MDRFTLVLAASAGAAVVGMIGAALWRAKERRQQGHKDTATMVAVMRAAGTREWDPLVRSNDMLAERLLPPLPRFLVGLLPFRWALRLIPGLYGYVLARTRFIDEAVEASLADGQVRQLVLLGAGLDTRCYRFALSENAVRGYELDLPFMSRKKRAALAAAGIDAGDTVFVEVEFGVEPLGDAMRRAGIETMQPTLFVFEGVSMYLTENDVFETLRTVSTFAPGSSIVCDVLGDEQNALMSMTRRYLATKGEEFRFGCSASDLGVLVCRAGLQVHTLLTPKEIHANLLTRADGSLAARTLPYTSVMLLQAKCT